jgi:hypothetical protein
MSLMYSRRAEPSVGWYIIHYGEMRGNFEVQGPPLRSAVAEHGAVKGGTVYSKLHVYDPTCKYMQVQ